MCCWCAGVATLYRPPMPRQVGMPDSAETLGPVMNNTLRDIRRMCTKASIVEIADSAIMVSPKPFFTQLANRWVGMAEAYDLHIQAHVIVQFRCSTNRIQDPLFVITKRTATEQS